MKNFRKTAVTILVLALMCALAAFFAACGGESAIKSISVDSAVSNVAFGSDLDLSDIKLKVTYEDGKTEEVALNADGVQVSGFDKDKVGEQKLTVTYKEKTTEFTVKVVSPMTAESYTQQYFVGDAFNRNRGRLRLAADNSTVDFNNEAVTIGEFDTSTAGEKTVTISYKLNDATTYSVNIKVNVYEVDDISIKSPNQISYVSHDTELNLAGGSLTLVNRAANFTRSDVITADMCTGFDAEAATIENLDNPLKQTITVAYKGKTKTFDIRIRFSSVSLMEQRADEIKALNLDWNTAVPSFTTQVGENAVDAMRRYLNEDTLVKELVEEEDALLVARVAAVQGLKLWKTAIGEYKTFTFIEEGVDKGLVEFLTTGTLEDAKADYEKLSDIDADIRVYGEMLNYMSYEFGNVNLYGNTKLYVYLSAVPSMSLSDESENIFNNILDALTYATGETNGLNGKFAAIAAAEDDTARNAAIKTAIKFIYEFDGHTYYGGDSTGIKDLSICKAVAKWNGIDDILNTFIQYCFKEDDAESINYVKYLGLTGEFDEFINEIMTCLNTVSSIISGNPFMGLVLDSSDFMVSYGKVDDKNDELAQSDNELVKWLYEVLTFDMQYDDDTTVTYTLPEFVEFIKTTGYDTVHGAFLGDEEYFAVWDMLLDIKAGLHNNEIPSEIDAALGEKIEAMFKAFAALSPAQQYGIIASMNPLYESEYFKMPAYALQFITTDENNEIKYTGGYTLFTNLIGTYYTNKLPDSANLVFSYMLAAMEDYARIYEGASLSQVSYFDTYIVNMTLAWQFHKDMTNSEDEAEREAIAKFDELLGDVFEKMVAVYNTYDIDATYDEEGNLAGWDAEQMETDEDKNPIFPLGEWEKDFSKLAYYALSTMTFGGGEMQVYEFAIASYERADEIARKILACNDVDIINAYRYFEFDLRKASPDGKIPEELTGEKMVMTMDQLMHYARSIYVSALTKGYTTSYWADYNKSATLKRFMYDSYDLYDLCYNRNIPQYKYTAEDREIIKDIVAKFRALDIKDKTLYLSINVGSGYSSYHLSLLVYVSVSLGTVNGEEIESTTASDYASEVVTLEAAYSAYEIAAEENKAEALERLEKQVKTVNDAKAALTDEDKTKFAGDYKFVEDMYEYYVNAYNELVK